MRNQCAVYGLLETREQLAPALVADLAHSLRRAGDVDEEHGREKAFRLGLLPSRAGDELLDCPKQVGVGNGPVVRRVPLEKACIREVVGQVAAVRCAHEAVAAALDDERGSPYELQDRPHLGESGSGRGREALDTAVPLLDPRV